MKIRLLHKRYLLKVYINCSLIYPRGFAEDVQQFYAMCACITAWRISPPDSCITLPISNTERPLLVQLPFRLVSQARLRVTSHTHTTRFVTNLTCGLHQYILHCYRATTVYQHKRCSCWPLVTAFWFYELILLPIHDSTKLVDYVTVLSEHSKIPPIMWIGWYLSTNKALSKRKIDPMCPM